jgi:hypothetical protein
MTDIRTNSPQHPKIEMVPTYSKELFPSLQTNGNFENLNFRDTGRMEISDEDEQWDSAQDLPSRNQNLSIAALRVAAADRCVRLLHSMRPYLSCRWQHLSSGECPTPSHHEEGRLVVI